MKLKKLLEQFTLELNVPEPDDAYDFDTIKVTDLGYGNYYKYTYTNNQGNVMEVTNLIKPVSADAVSGKITQPGKVIFIAFGLYDDADEEEDGYHDDESEERKYGVKTGAGDTIKVLATVVEATKRTMEKEGGEKNIYAIAFAPSDKKRKNIYDHYLTTLFPNFKKDERPSSVGFTFFINQDFKGRTKVDQDETN